MIAASAVMTSVAIDGQALPVKQLKGTEPVETLDLSGSSSKGRLGVTSGIVIAKLIEFNAVLIKLDMRLNPLTDEGRKVMRDAAEGREGFELLL